MNPLPARHDRGVITSNESLSPRGETRPLPRVRRILGVGELRVPAQRGDETIRRWRGALFSDGSLKFWTGDEFADLFDEEQWIEDPAPPEQVRVALEFVCTWQAMPDRDEVPVPAFSPEVT